MKSRLSRTHVPLLATSAVFALFYAGASFRYDGFFSWTVFVNLLHDNAFLGLAAIGMTFVILAGGIDLSVGALVGFTSTFIARLIAHQLHPLPAILIALVIGTGFGAGMGALIRFTALPPFLVTLAGMFFMRGLGFAVSLETIPIKHPFYEAISEFSLRVFPVTAILFLSVLGAAIYLAHYTRFGRAIYAIGGSESSAVLMGLPVGRTKIGLYALSGLCAALGGVTYTFYTSSGNATAGTMLELDAIAAVVIGGTLLSGGVGYVFGTLIGVLILGVIQTIITFQGTWSSWWTKIAIGLLLLGFILLQRFLQSSAGRGGLGVANPAMARNMP
ncbi:MAG TPA: galactofuranose ABC transporter, permease protein YjfF [Verrucomicrobiae bacterium]|nr:galactofuranose ABC transporter, permease protein YjfF [Verrucomicrobiae bacterium]